MQNNEVEFIGTYRAENSLLTLERNRFAEEEKDDMTCGC